MKNSILAIMVALVVLSVATVYVLSGMASKHNVGNGFTRKFATHKTLMPIDTLDIKFDSYYIAGNTDHHLYLGNIVAPRHLLIVNIATLDTQRVELQLHNPDKLAFYKVRVEVDSPFFYMYDGAVPAIFKGMLHSNQAYLIEESRAYFLDFEPLKEKSFVIRSLNDNKEAQLGKLTQIPFRVDFHKELLQKQVDGIFCTEGALHCNKDNTKLVYVYLYRNQYIVMDTSLNILFKGNTIDTTTTAKLKVAMVSSANTRALSAPPVNVNKASTIQDNLLFINSALQADNESQQEFKSVSAIDVYNLDNGQYIASFYVPTYAGDKLRDFRICRHKMLAFYRSHVVVYSLTMKEKKPPL